jgi:hypothetical protein
MKRFAAAFLLFATVVNAQQNEAVDAAKKKVQPKTEIIFENGTDIDGDIAGPNLETISVVPSRKFGSLLKVRDNFKDKLMESVYDL